MNSSCTFCLEMKIRIYVSHKREECPVLASAYCGNCCSYGLHYASYCPNKPICSKPGSKPRESAPPKEASNVYTLKGDEEHMKSYLKVFDIQTKGLKISDKKLRKMVDECAVKNGYTGVYFI